ncbi:MAG: helix-turn-helix domain-containing protein [Jatrophihabitans sp.]
MLIANVDGPLAGFLAIAITDLQKRFALSSLKAPAGTDELVAALTLNATGRQTTPTLAELAEVLECVSMTRLTIDYDEAAEALHVSRRSVDRLVASGELSTVNIGGSVRIRTTDLSGYVESLITISRNESPRT